MVAPRRLDLRDGVGRHRHPPRQSARQTSLVDADIGRDRSAQLYGLYLWSWPISIVLGAVDGSIVRFVAAMAVTAVVSEASYRWIEIPLRRARWKLPNFAASVPRLATSALSVVGVVALAAFYVNVDSFERFASDDVATFDAIAAVGSTTTSATVVHDTTAIPSTVVTAPDPIDPTTTAAARTTTSTAVTTVTTSTTTTTTTTTLPPTAETTRLAIVGDSTANALAVNQPNGISSIYPTIVNRSRDGCSVYDSGRILTAAAFRNDFTRCAGWRDSWMRAATDADVVLVVIGAWDVFDIQDGDITYPFDTTEGDQHCTNNLRSGIDTIIAGGARVGLLEVEPGTVVEYSTGTTMLIARIISQETGLYGADLEAFLTDRLFEPLGIDDVRLGFDSTGVWHGGSTTDTTTRNFAKLGLLYLRGGVWEDEQFLPSEWADFVRTPAVESYYGAQFWVDGDGRFRMVGLNGQGVYIAPDLDLVVAVNNSGGNQYGAARLFEDAQAPSCVDDPIAVDDRATAAAGATVTIDVLANDPGRGEQLAPATLTIGEIPDIGSARTQDAKVLYTAPSDRIGTDTMSYVVCTVSRRCEEATVEIDITPIDPGIDATEPARLLDTRPAGRTVDGRSQRSGPVAAGEVVEVQIAGRGPVPGDARTAAINLTAVTPSADGFATLYACDGPPPNASTINFQAGSNIANATIGHLSDSGSICIFPSTQSHFIIDTAAWVPTDTDVESFEPERLLDTRSAGKTIDGRSQATGPLRANEIIEIPVAGRGTTPADATAVVASVIAVGPEADGYVTIYPCGGDPPTASTVNFERGQNIANATVVRVSENGSICAFVSAGSHVVVDVTASIPAMSRVRAFSPERFLDTRDGDRIGAGETIEVPIAGHGSVPDGATAAYVNLTAIDPLAPGYATLFACGDTPPNASVLNSAPGTNVANAIAVRLSPSGSICLYSSNNTHYALDVVASIT